MDTLFGAVERIIFCNPENGYTVLRLRPDAHLGQRLVIQGQNYKLNLASSLCPPVIP